MDDTGRRDDELTSLRRQLVLARFYLERFADPHSFVWVASDKAPHELAREALVEIDGQATTPAPPPADGQGNGGFPIGTGRLLRLVGGRPGFVEFHQVLARQALDIGRVGAARAALWVLRASDFAVEAHIAEALLAVVRDSTSSDEQLAEAALRLTRLEPWSGREPPR